MAAAAQLNAVFFIEIWLGRQVARARILSDGAAAAFTLISGRGNLLNTYALYERRFHEAQDAAAVNQQRCGHRRALQIDEIDGAHN